MMRIVIYAVLMCGVLLIISCDRQQPVSPTTDLTELGREIVSSMAQGTYDKVFARFDTKMQEVMPAQKIEQAWTSLEAQSGVFQKQVGVRQTKEQGYDVVYVTCEFEKVVIDIKVVFNNDKQISGLWFIPTQ